MVSRELLQFVCLTLWLVAEARAYVLVADKKPWLEALDYCRRNYADLASVRSDAEQDLVSSAAGDGEAWIGLNGSSDGRWVWSDGDGVPFTKWALGEPNDAPSCVRVKNGSWYDRNCTAHYSFICSEAPQAPWSRTGRRYYFIQLSESWYAARDYCRGNYTDLASIQSDAEHVQLRQVSGWNTSAWIGLYRCTQNTWRWSNGENAYYQTWQYGELNRTASACVSIDDAWYHADCADRKPFICYKDMLVTQIQQIQNKPSCSWPSYSASPPSAVTTTTKATPSPQVTRKSKQMTTISPPEATTRTSFPAPGSSIAPASTRRSSSMSVQGTVANSAGNFSSYNLHLILKPMSWSEARGYCRLAHTDLASVPAGDVQRVISKLLTYPDTVPGVWIGLRRSRVWGYWYWVNDDPSDFSYWGEGEPSNPLSERCGMVSRTPGRNFTWEDECCGVQLPFICY